MTSDEDDGEDDEFLDVKDDILGDEDGQLERGRRGSNKPAYDSSQGRAKPFMFD